MLLQREDLLVVLVGFLSVLILCLLEVIVESLDLEVELLFLVAEAVELALLAQCILDVLPELPVGQVPQLIVQKLQSVDEVVLVRLDLPLVALHVRVVLQLAAQGACRVLQLLGHSLL